MFWHWLYLCVDKNCQSGSTMTEIKFDTNKRGWLWLALLTAIFYIFYLLHGILLPFVTGFLVAYLLNPLVHKLKKYGFSRTISTMTLIFAFFIILGGALFIAIPFLKKELLKLAYKMPDYVNRTIAFIEPYVIQLQNLAKTNDFKNLDETVSAYFGDMASWALTVLAGLFSNTLALANLISLIILTPVVAFYLLRDWPRLLASLDNLLPRDQAPKIRTILSEIHFKLGAYFRGQSLVCLTLALYYIVALTVTGLDFSITIGLITGIMAFIPYFGYLIGVTAGISVAIGQFTDWVYIWAVVGVFAGGQIIETYYLLPKLVGDRIDLHPVWIIFALLTGGLLFGFTGIMLAMPVAAMMGVLIRFALKEYRHSSLYARHTLQQIESLE